MDRRLLNYVNITYRAGYATIIGATLMGDQKSRENRNLEANFGNRFLQSRDGAHYQTSED
jgi:hypothetical protein